MTPESSGDSGTLSVSSEVFWSIEKLRNELGLGTANEAIKYLLRCRQTSLTSTVGELPFEVFAMVFTYLDCITLRLSCQVSQRWHHIVKGDAVLRPLSQGSWLGLYVVGGIRPSENRTSMPSTLSELTRFNPVFKTWTNQPAMKEERYHSAAVALDRQLYVLCGRNNKTRLSSVEKYDMISGEWSFLPSMKTVRSAPAAAVHNGCIYVFGGFDGKEEHRSIEKFDPRTAQWTNDECKSRMPIEACEVSAVVHNSDIYIIGGTQSRYSQQENILAVCQRYHPSTDTWTVVRPMNHKRMCPASAVLNGKIYVIGGSNGVSSLDVVEVYDPKTDQWTTSPPMNICRSNATACVFQGEIYVAGGFCSGALDTVEKFNPLTNQWAMVTRMPTKRDACKLIAFE